MIHFNFDNDDDGQCHMTLTIKQPVTMSNLLLVYNFLHSALLNSDKNYRIAGLFTQVFIFHDFFQDHQN
jgi:hypothetical protein